MSFYVAYTPDASGIITTSFSVFDADQDNISLISVSVIVKNGAYITPFTPAWISTSVSGSYLVPGGYKGSMSKLDVFLYIDTDHPTIETGSHYVLRCYYTDGKNTRYTDLSFFNGNFDLWYPPSLFLLSRARESSALTIGPAQIHLSSSVFNHYDGINVAGSTFTGHQTISNLLGYNIAGYRINVIERITYSFGNLQSMDYFRMFCPFLKGSVPGPNDIFVNLYNFFYQASLFYMYPVNDTRSFVIMFPNFTFSVTISEAFTYKMNLLEYAVEKVTETTSIVSFFINGIQITSSVINYGVGELFAYTNQIRIFNSMSFYIYNDLAIYTEKLSDEEIRFIRNYYFFKYYPLLTSRSIWRNNVLVT